MKIITHDQAVDQGFVVLAGLYRLPDEQLMLDAVLADMDRDRIPTRLVAYGRAVEVWRSKVGTDPFSEKNPPHLSRSSD